MPEIKNELPTDDELRAYLAESLNRPMLIMLTGVLQEPHRDDPDRAEALAYLSTLPSRVEFLTAVNETVFEAAKQQRGQGWLDTSTCTYCHAGRGIQTL